MISEAASMSSTVVAQVVSGNPVQQQISIQVIKDQMNAEAELTSKIVNSTTDTAGGRGVSSGSQYIDRYM